MTTAAKSTFGTKLIWNYRELAELISISGPTQKVDTIEVTSHDSASAFKEFIAGMIGGGEITVEGNFIASDTYGQIVFNTDKQARNKRTIWIVMPMAVGAAWTAEAIATALEMSYPHDGKLGLSATLAITGKPTLTVTQTTGMSGLTGIEETDSTALEISPAIAVGTYAYTCTVDTASSYVKLTPVAASHTIYIQGTAVDTGVQSGEIALGAAGTDTVIFIMAYESAKAPRLYRLTVTRPAA